MRLDRQHWRPVRVAIRFACIVAHSFRLGDGVRHKVLVLYVLLRWQLIAGLGLGVRLPAPKRIDLKLNGVKLPICSPDGDIGFPLVLYEVFVREDYKVDLPHEPACVLDVGANYGLASLYLTANHPSAIIHALEPSAPNFDVLERNTQRFPNIRRHRVGLFSLTGPATLYQRDLGIQSSLVVRGRRTENVDLMTLDDFLVANRIEHVDLMKLDVEGAEEEIITASRSIANIDVIVAELHLKVIRKERVLASLEPLFVSRLEAHGGDFELVVATNRGLAERQA